MVAEVRPNYPTEWAAMKAVAAPQRIGHGSTQSRRLEGNRLTLPAPKSAPALPVTPGPRMKPPECGGLAAPDHLGRPVPRPCLAPGEVETLVDQAGEVTQGAPGGQALQGEADGEKITGADRSAAS